MSRGVKKMRESEDDLNVICKNCGYEKGVHSMFNYYCPFDDPYVMARDREWDFDSFFEPEPPKDNS